MEFLDKLKVKANEAKDKATEMVDDHAPQIKNGIGKAGAYVDKKTKGKYADKIAKGTKTAEQAVDKLDRKPDPSAKPTKPTKPTGRSGANGAAGSADPKRPDTA